MMSTRSIAPLRFGLAACAAAAMLMTGSAASAQSSNAASSQGLVGVWFVQVTLRSCATGAPMGTFNSLVTFHRGGTVSETTTAPAFAIGQRGPGTGTWEADGHDQFTQRMIALINFDTPANLPGTPGFNPALPISPGFFTGWSIVTQTLELTDRNHASSSGTNEFYKADGTLYRTGCSTAEAVRFE